MAAWLIHSKSISVFSFGKRREESHTRCQDYSQQKAYIARWLFELCGNAIFPWKLNSTVQCRSDICLLQAAGR